MRFFFPTCLALTALASCSLIRDLDEYGSGGAGGGQSSGTIVPGPIPPFTYVRVLGPGDARPLGFGPLDDAETASGVPRTDPTVRLAAASDGTTWVVFVSSGVVDADPSDAVAPVGSPGRESVFVFRFGASGGVTRQIAHAIESDVPGSVVVTGATVLPAGGPATDDLVATFTLIGKTAIVVDLANGGTQRAESTETAPTGLDGMVLRFDAAGYYAAGARFGGVDRRATAMTIASDPDDGVWVGGGRVGGMQVTGLDGTLQPCGGSENTGSFVARLDGTMTCRSVTNTYQLGVSGTTPLQAPLSIDVSTEHVVLGGFLRVVTQYALDEAQAEQRTFSMQDESASGYVLRLRRPVDPSTPMGADWGVSIKDGDPTARHRVEGVAISREGGAEPGSVFVAGSFEQMEDDFNLAPLKVFQGDDKMNCTLASNLAPGRGRDVFVAWIAADGTCRSSLVIGGAGVDAPVGLLRLVEVDGASRVAVPLLFASPPSGFDTTFAIPGDSLGGVGAFVFDGQGISTLGSSFLLGRASHVASMVRAPGGAITIAGSSAGPAAGIAEGSPPTLFVGQLMPEHTP